MIELQVDRPQSNVARPKVSFVVAWQGCPDELSRRLQSWDRWVHEGIDVVVVCTCPPADRQRIEWAHPGVRVVNASADEELSALRQRGVSAANGDIVMIIDDTIGWNLSWRDHLPVAIGGAVLPRQDAPWVGFERAPEPMKDASVQ